MSDDESDEDHNDVKRFKDIEEIGTINYLKLDYSHYIDKVRFVY